MESARGLGVKESKNIFLDSSPQPQQVIYTPPNFRSPQESRDCEILIWRERLKNEPGIKQYYVAPLANKGKFVLTPLLVRLKIMTNSPLPLPAPAPRLTLQ